MKPPLKERSELISAVAAGASVPEEQAFAEVVEMIENAHRRTFAAVNTALIELYWQVGEYLSRKIETAAWGDSVVDALASYIHQRRPNLRGFTRRNLF